MGTAADEEKEIMMDRQAQAMSFYEAHDVHNQYYIDRANFESFRASEMPKPNKYYYYSIKPYLRSEVSREEFFNYDKILLILDQDGTFLENIKSENINRKMCEIALRQNLDAMKYIPQNLWKDVFIAFDAGYKKSKTQESDSIIMDALLEKIETKLWKFVFDTKENLPDKGKRREKDMLWRFYHADKKSNYQEDKDNFKTIRNRLSPLDRLSYDEVLINLSHCGLLLQHIPKKNRNRKMCLISVYETSEAIKYVPREYFWDVSKYVNNWDASYNKEFEFMRKYGWVEQTKSQKISP